MRRINTRFLLGLIITLVLLAGGVQLLHAVQSERIARALKWQADHAASEGDRRRSAQYLARYLEFAPDDVETRIHLGKLLEELYHDDRHFRDGLRALQVYDRVVRTAPENEEVRRRFVPLALRLGRHADALDHLKVLLDAHPDDAELHRQLAQCHEALGRYAEAAQAYATATRHDPHQVETFLAWAHLLRRRLDRADEAEAVINTLVERNPRSADAFLARARFRLESLPLEQALEKGLLALAEQDVAAARQLEPEAANVLLAASDVAQLNALLAQRGGDTTKAHALTEQARQYLRRGIDLHPQSVRMYQALAWLELSVPRPAEAVRWLNQGLSRVTNPRERSELLWTLAEVQIQEGSPDDARQTIQQLRAANYPAAALDYLQARLLLRGQQWGAACQLFEQVRQHPGLSKELLQQIDLCLGECYDKLDEPDRQVEALQRVLSSDPNSVPARYGKAVALARLGRLDDAITELEQVLPQAGAPPAGWKTLARFRFAQALRQPAAQRDWKAFTKALDRAQRATPNAWEVTALRVEYLLALEPPRADEARQLLDQAERQHPERVEVWIARAAIEERLRRLEAALNVLDEAERKLGDSVDLRLARVGLWADRPAAEALPALAALSRDLQTFSADEQARLLRGLADAFDKHGAAQEARRLRRQVVELQPHDVRTRSQLLAAALQAGDEADAQHWLRDIQRHEGVGHTVSQFWEARRLLAQARRGDRQAQSLAAQVVHQVLAQRPSWAAAVLTRAELEDLQGNSEAALRDYLRAVELGERNAGALGRLLYLLTQRRRYAEALEVVRRCCNDQSLPRELYRAAAETCRLAGDKELALSLARSAVPGESRDHRDWLWLGQMLWALEQPADAVTALRRAVALNESEADTWVALVQCLTQMGRATEAEEVVHQAQSKLGGDRKDLALAACWEAVGRRDLAQRLYQQQLERRPHDPLVVRPVAEFYLRAHQPAQAEPLLRRLLEPQLHAGPEEANWARRRLAVQLAGSGSLTRCREALALLDQIADPSADDLRARAVVLAGQKSRRFPGQSETARRQAIRLLEELVQRGEATTADQFLLAQLYEADGDWPRARARMQPVLAARDVTAMHLGTYVRALLRHGETEAAEPWVSALKKLHAGDPQTLDAEARWLHAQGKVSEVVRLVSAGPDAKLSPEQRAADVAFRAALLDELAQTTPEPAATAAPLSDAAEMLYRRLAEVKPREFQGLAVHLARRGRVDEAQAWLRKAWEQLPPEQAGAVSLAVLRAGMADSAKPAWQAASQLVDERLRAALAAQPQSLALLVFWADLRDIQGRYADAEQLYRQVLARDPNHVVALNNLAWLLAQRERGGDEALALVNRAIDLVGPIGELLDTRAVVLLRLGRVDAETVHDLEEALREAPTPAKYFHLAQARQRLRDRAAAAQAFVQNKGLVVKPSDLHPLELPAYEHLRRELGVN
ncbi:MAG: tetratricopeptide repeat protein [Gemmataceae bacterium]|nr:tetratricopeptide repeat protein [Gemmataceae bacterium]MDW8265026.1 tetratricopeptide repeat protein [Gemmataceae bacterium]